MTVKDYFEQRARSGTWASLYDNGLDARTYNFITRREAALRLLEPDGTFARILDVGCGTGDYIYVAVRHHGIYYGVDFSWSMIHQARQRIRDHGERHVVLVASGEHLPYQDSCFDLVLAIGYIEYFRNPIPTIREIRRILKPGGVLVMQSCKPDLFGTLDRVFVSPLRAVSRWVINRGAAAFPPLEVDRSYSQRHLDTLLQKFGFMHTAHAFNNFCPFPSFLRVRVPRLSIRLSEAMGRSNPMFWRFLAVNYIGKYVLEKSDAQERSRGGDG